MMEKITVNEKVMLRSIHGPSLETPAPPYPSYSLPHCILAFFVTLITGHTHKHTHTHTHTHTYICNIHYKQTSISLGIYMSIYRSIYSFIWYMHKCICVHVCVCVCVFCCTVSFLFQFVLVQFFSLLILPKIQDKQQCFQAMSLIPE